MRPHTTTGLPRLGRSPAPSSSPLSHKRLKHPQEHSTPRGTACACPVHAGLEADALPIPPTCKSHGHKMSYRHIHISWQKGADGYGYGGCPAGDYKFGYCRVMRLQNRVRLLD